MNASQRKPRAKRKKKSFYLGYEQLDIKERRALKLKLLFIEYLCNTS